MKKEEITEKDLEIIIDRVKASLRLSGMQNFGANYSDEQVTKSLNNILNALGSRKIKVTTP